MENKKQVAAIIAVTQYYTTPANKQKIQWTDYGIGWMHQLRNKRIPN